MVPMFINSWYNLCHEELWTLETYKIENQEQYIYDYHGKKNAR